MCYLFILILHFIILIAHICFKLYIILLVPYLIKGYIIQYVLKGFIANANRKYVISGVFFFYSMINMHGKSIDKKRYQYEALCNPISNPLIIASNLKTNEWHHCKLFHLNEEPQGDPGCYFAGKTSWSKIIVN